MGFLSKLFGQSNVDVSHILNAVARNGGQGIVEVPYDTFDSYLRAQGTEHQVGAGAMECLLNLDGKRHKVVIDRGLFHDLKRGQTLVMVKPSIDFSSSNDREIATILKNSLSSMFVTDRDSAYKAAWQVLAMGESDYMHYCWGQGDMDTKLEDLRTPMIAQFHAQGPTEAETGIDWHQFSDFLNDVMGAIQEPPRRLDVSYFVAEQFIQEWNLAE